MSALAGAQHVTVSDYPSPAILEALKDNVVHNLKPDISASTSVEGHAWGTFTDELSRTKRNFFTRILSADCIWMRDKQLDLLSSFTHFLSPSPEARIWIVAGFHTGREVVALFFERARSANFEIEVIWERDVNGNERAWETQRDAFEDDIEYRRKWLAVACLKRKVPVVQNETGVANV